MKPTGVHRSAQRRHAEGEQDKRQRRRQSEPKPSRESAEKPPARDPDANPDLTARRSRQKLTERDEIDVAALIEPLPAHHILVAKITKMRNRPAE